MFCIVWLILHPAVTVSEFWIPGMYLRMVVRMYSLSFCTIIVMRKQETAKTYASSVGIVKLRSKGFSEHLSMKIIPLLPPRI